MKIVSLMIALCFSMNVFAANGSIRAFEMILDDYQYAMSVEWDQKDVMFQEKRTKEFIHKLQQLIEEGSLSQQDVITVVEQRINNKTLVNAFKLKAKLAGEMNSKDELIKFIRESSTDLYAQGASWNGRIVIPLAIVAGVITALGIAIWYSATHGCQEYAQTCDQFGCRNNYDVCLDYGYVGPHL